MAFLGVGGAVSDISTQFGEFSTVHVQCLFHGSPVILTSLLPSSSKEKRTPSITMSRLAGGVLE